MPKAWCPDCDTLQDITPNGVDPKLSNKRQRIAFHTILVNVVLGGKVEFHERCNGSGKDV